MKPIHPKKTLLPLDVARELSHADYLCQRKYDGELVSLPLAGGIILCERVRAKSGGFLTASDRRMIQTHGEFFAAITVQELNGYPMLNETTADRWIALQNLRPYLPANMILAETIYDVPAAIQDGAEGVCFHPWAGTWVQGMLCHKAGLILTVKVLSIGPGQSVTVADATTGELRGKLPLRGGKADQVRPGSILRAECMSLTDSGLMRQSQPCRDWLVSV